MTKRSIREYAEALRVRYQAANKRDKGLILDEFCRTTSYHRKAAIRLLWRPGWARGRQRGRRPRYGPEVVTALKAVWLAADRICSKRLAPFLPELVPMLERAGELQLPPRVEAQLLGLSAATIDRLLATARQQYPRRPYSQSRSNSALKALIPVRTFGEWAEVAPGSLQADLVSHCGESTHGFYLTTLVAVDVASGWSEFEAVWGKGQRRVGAGVHQVRRRLPIPLRELHTDNGGEFLNQLLYPYCQQYGIRLTRGRPYKKNDQAYAEQKNGAVVRRLVGYDRYASKAAYERLQRLYGLVRLYVNFCQPVRKLVAKQRQGAKVTKRFDQARTPYQRLLENGALGESDRQALARQYVALKPLWLRTQIETELERLWKLSQKQTAASQELAEKEPVR